MNEQADIRIVKEGSVAVVEFTESVVSDLDGIAQSARLLKTFVDENEPGRVIFDFDRVSFFSSQVLGLILETRARLLNWEGLVAICNTNSQLQRVFKITNLDKIFKFFPDRSSAVLSMTSGTIEGNIEQT
jgi:anti-sigma B factor antagonist